MSVAVLTRQSVKLYECFLIGANQGVTVLDDITATLLPLRRKLPKFLYVLDSVREGKRRLGLGAIPSAPIPAFPSTSW